ncbi:MAG: TonB-dependent receptor [Pedobacter sp.]|nr:TonB-dependent receptor [Pedobacter sp.]
MKAIFTLLLLIASITLNAQIRISGTVKSNNGEIIIGANISIVNTYDGASTDTAGRFKFSTTETGKQLIRYTAIGYKTDSMWVNLTGAELMLNLKLKEAVSELNMVTISAGTLETGDQRKGAVLSSLDIATTAGAVADVVAALQTLPGTAQAFGENGLFVRGGSGAETQTYYDGMLVKNPFGSQLPDLNSRSRFSPFLFKGTTFSSGGYSAQYGQALSSALLMESKDLPEKSSTEISLLSVGLSAAHTVKTENSALTIGGNYYNLKPMYTVFKQNVNWDKEPIEAQGMVQYKWKPTQTGILKVFAQYNNSNVALFSNSNYITNANNTYYANSTYQDYLGSNWKIQAGISYSNSKEKGGISTNNYRRFDNLLQGRVTLSHFFGKRSLIRMGAEAYSSERLEGWNELARSFDNQTQAGFAETEVYLGDAIVARLGARTEHASYLKEWNIAPRASLALKTGKRAQVSFAYGTFYQNPDDGYLVQNQNLTAERADHYILNYQYLTDKITFRVEGYSKKYDQLTKYDFNGITNAHGVFEYKNLNNTGSGYARGIEVFFRDKKSIPAGDYWISYSYLDTKRDFRNYPSPATPPFAASHTLNLVYKQYIPYLKSEIGTTYSFSSGRTYYNPNNAGFLADKTKSFNNLSLNVSHLTTVFKQFAVVYASVTNLPGFKNVYGYNYSPNGQQREAILPAAKRNFFIGLLINIGDNTFNH